ncbi:putative bifunctional diguanylate cyclase/phosphodiesterase [Rhodovastum atsumiense]|uniref:putative bifunctional diguanylate cyclase/phosphodiesterase n=1 Tax=Rhodovastum atsumiense TaxID=504468 RepID=UPI00139F2A37|nr:EAL domain-containing protein [Rhodovastum atsumiense]
MASFRFVHHRSLFAKCAALLRSLAGSTRQIADRSVTLTVTILAALAATAFALAPPVSSYFANLSRLQGALETSARLHAAEVTILARQTPSFWEFDGLRVSAATPEGQSLTPPERRRVFDPSGRLVLESVPPEDLAWPVLSQRAPVMDGESRLGEAEASRSFRAPLITTALIGLGSALAGALLFIVLRVIPLRLLHQALERASYLSAHDVLTGLPNRSLFSDRLEQALAMARREGGHIAVLCLDLDRFKEVNDTLGHAAGDQLLRTVAARLRACLRESDTLARLGGDEFAVIQPRPVRSEDAQTVASRLVKALEEPIILNGQQASVGVSIGIAFGNGDSDAGQMLKDADVALYQAKDAGRGGFCFFAPEMNARLFERRAMELDLRAALGNGSLFLNYQPQVDVRTGQVIGAEALLRWNRPEHGLVPPDRFIGLAEEIGLIGQIGAWVLQEACRVAATWPDPIGIAVNVSPVQFRLPGFHETVRTALEASGLAPSRLEVEITEGVLLKDTDDTLAELSRIRELGVHIAMDDFGTGYSSLGYLQKFRFDKIKIDRSFVKRLDEDPNAIAIVRAVVGLSEALGVTTNAEGVETVAQADLLRSEGCAEVQGYLYGRPMSPEAFTQLLQAGRSAA